ncbi:MAG: KUP/HAK/KT family potassium transporter [Candidatus Nanopelagicales bacterium]
MEKRSTIKKAGLPIMSLGALGVVFGDIGTSPLYAFEDIFRAPHAIPITEPRVLGAASLVFWTLTLIVSVKYVLVVMRADNDGEGGIMSLSSLAAGKRIRNKRNKTVILTAGILGAALFYGDGMITPAISVLSAVEGLEVVNPGFDQWVTPIALVIVIALFSVQRFGIHRIGRLFGPVMLLWFISIGILGLLSVISSPAVLTAINPAHAIDFFAGDTGIAFLALGSVVLCVTGAEALYADMGQFGRTPIRISWFAITVPALYLNYFGQAALVLRDPDAINNTFYLLVPAALQIVMVILATVATVIASQSMISGVFSMTRQAIHLGYLPPLKIRHTSDSERGQVYIPAVNWGLLVCVVGLIVAFKSSANLSSAYGIAVTGTFVVTTVLITIVAIKRWKLNKFIAFPLAAIFLFVDITFFTSSLTKFDHGGWFPLAVGAIIFIILTTWAVGSKLQRRAISAKTPLLKKFAKKYDLDYISTSPGTAVYITTLERHAPPALIEYMRGFNSIAENTIILSMVTTNEPWVDERDRISITSIGPHVSQVTVTNGYMDIIDLNRAIELTNEKGLDIAANKVTWVLFVPTIKPTKSHLMSRPAQVLFDLMVRLTPNPAFYWNVPPEQTLQLGNVINLNDAQIYLDKHHN